MLAKIVHTDRDPQGDLKDITSDIAAITHSEDTVIPWGWYEEGFDKEPTDENSGPVDAEGTHAAYVTHHNGPQYFGYISNNPQMYSHLHGMHDFFMAVQHHTLPAKGVFYIKGGLLNQFNLKPEDPAAQVQQNFLGDDDHPGYSDSRISESLVAETVNDIARSPYWKHCAIIITWDDSEGDYDHVPPPAITTGPDGKQLTDGPRVPFLLISPWSKTHYIDHAVGSQSTVVRFVDEVFNLIPLQKLPDEQKGIRIGEKKGLANEGPTDDSPLVTDLLQAFDPARLTGRAPMLPPSYAIIPEKLVLTQPADLHYGLKQLGIVPTDYALGIHNHIPSDFNPRPSTTPGK